MLACKFVDCIAHDIPYGEIHPAAPGVDKTQADLIFHGDDEIVLPDGTTNMYGVARASGVFRSLRRTEGISTTLLVQRMLGEISEDDSRSLGLHMQATSSRVAQFARHGGVRSEKRAVIYVEGLFDLLHCGHLEILERILARESTSMLDSGESEDDGCCSPRGATYSAHRDMRIRTHGKRASDPFVIAGILDRPDCVQTVHERGLCALSLRGIDEVILGAGLGKAPREEWANFKSALGVDRVYVVKGHSDFEPQGWLADATAVNDLKKELISIDCSDVGTDREGLLSRFRSNKEQFERRQKVKKEPAMVPRTKEELQAMMN